MGLCMVKGLEKHFMHSKCSINFAYYSYFTNEETKVRKISFPKIT